MAVTRALEGYLARVREFGAGNVLLYYIPAAS